MDDGASLRLTIDLAALAGNWRRMADAAKGAECAGVVKAGAYGIGIEPAVEALLRAGCATFFVAVPSEGAVARAVAPAAPIYVLAGFRDEWSALFAEHGLRPVINSLDQLDAWRLAGGGPYALHVDTGINRLGLTLHEALELSRRGDSLQPPSLVMSHLACADMPDLAMNREQLALFEETRKLFAGVPASLANSGGVALGADYHFDLVRPGIALYGGRFSLDVPPLAPVVTAEARVLQVREAGAGETVGYGATERLKRPSRLAVLGAGYGDGYLRAAGSSDERKGAMVFIRGRAVPLVGRVSMDLAVADVTGMPAVHPGDWAELFGPHIPLDQVAGHAGTIGYELLTGLSRRAERIYRGVPIH